MQTDLPILGALNEPLEYVSREVGSVSPIARKRGDHYSKLAERPVTPNSGKTWEAEESLMALKPKNEDVKAVSVPREKLAELMQLQTEMPLLLKEDVADRWRALLHVVAVDSRPAFERLLRTREHAEEALKALKAHLNQLSSKDFEEIKLIKSPCPADLDTVKAVLQLTAQLDRDGIIKYRDVKQWTLLRKQLTKPEHMVKLLRGLPEHLLKYKVQVKWRKGDVNPELAEVSEILRQASSLQENLAKLRRKTNIENYFAVSALEVEELEEVVKQEEQELEQLKKRFKEQQKTKQFKQFEHVLQQVLHDQLSRGSAAGSWSDDLCSRVERLGLVRNAEAKTLFSEFVAQAEASYAQMQPKSEARSNERALQQNWSLQQLAREKQRLPNYSLKFRRR